MGSGSMKYTRFRDIPQVTRSGAWECAYQPEGIWEQLRIRFRPQLPTAARVDRKTADRVAGIFS